MQGFLKINEKICVTGYTFASRRVNSNKSADAVK